MRRGGGEGGTNGAETDTLSPETRPPDQDEKEETGPPRGCLELDARGHRSGLAARAECPRPFLTQPAGEADHQLT